MRCLIVLLSLLTIANNVIAYNTSDNIVLDLTGKYSEAITAWDDELGTVKRIAGKNIKLFEPPFVEEKTVDLVLSFLDNNSDVFHTDTTNYKVSSCCKYECFYEVILCQYVHDCPIYGSCLHFRISYNGEMLYLKSKIYKNINVDTEPVVTIEQAREFVSQKYQVSNSNIKNENLVVVYNEDMKEYQLSWILKVNNSYKNFSKDIFINALNGSVIRENDNGHYSTINGTVTIPTWNGIPSSAPDDTTKCCKYSRIYAYDIYNINNVATTDASGSYIVTIDDYDHAEFLLTGPHADVLIFSEPDTTRAKYITSNSGNINYMWPVSDAHNYEYALFYRMNQAWEEYDAVPGFSTNRFHDNPMIGYAYYTGGDSFADDDRRIYIANYQAVPQGVYHEYSHNVFGGRKTSDLQPSAYVPLDESNAEATAMNEGFADYFACSFTNNPEYFSGRDLSNPYEDYYEDYLPATSAKRYIGGELIGSACWGMRNTYGSDVMEDLVYNAIKALNTDESFCDFVDELILYDDIRDTGNDEPDPSDGTPHLSSIIVNFNENHHLNGRQHKIGSVYTNETWSGTVWVMNDVVIPSGVSVTIEENAIIKVLPGKEISVAGTLNVGNNVTFSRASASSSTWDGIDIESGGSLSVSGSATISYAYTGIDIYGTSPLSIPNGNVLTISDCTLYGIFIHDCNPNIKNVHVTSTTAGIAASCTTADVTLHDLTLTYNGEAIILGNYSDAQIYLCDIRNNTGHCIWTGSYLDIYMDGDSGYGHNTIAPESDRKAIYNNATCDTVRAEYNFWGDTPNDSYFLTPGKVIYTNALASAYSGVGYGKMALAKIDNPFIEASQLEKNGDLDSAYNKYLDIVEKATTTTDKKRAIKSLISIQKKTSGDYGQVKNIIEEELALTTSIGYRHTLDFLLSEITLYEGNPRQAIQEFEKKSLKYQNTPMEVEMLAHIASIYGRVLNNSSKALEYANRAKDINPGQLILLSAFDAAGLKYNPNEYTDRYAEWDGVYKQLEEGEETEAEILTASISISPNPANPATTLHYTLAKPGNVKLAVYNSNGQKVATLVDNYMSAGNHSAVFDGSDLASGVYFYRLESKDFAKSGKMLLIK